MRAAYAIAEEDRVGHVRRLGTLIDWETGIYDAFAKEAERDGFTIDRDQLIPAFMETEKEIEGG